VRRPDSPKNKEGYIIKKLRGHQVDCRKEAIDRSDDKPK
jgi:hypothetical protein